MGKWQYRVIKFIVMIAVFMVTVVAANSLLNRGNTDMTSDMSPASLPVIYMNVNDEYINPLHGYTVEMEGNYLRESITPLMANRSLSFKAKLFDAVIAKVAYEVRPLDMSRLIEDTEVNDFAYENNEINASITLKDLINDDEEYMLIIKLTTSSGDIIRYYARIINTSELYIGEKVAFVRDFSAKTFNKDTAQNIRQYMESNADGDNSSFSYVNIHSSFEQLTWGNLMPTLQTSKELEIIDIDQMSASIKLSYQVEANGELHDVTEFFRVERGKSRMYLMDYERKMNQVFDVEKTVVVNGKVLHGIIDGNIERIENNNANILVFVQEDALYSFNTSTNTMARLFSFYDKDNDDVRTRYDAHDIKPLQVDDAGNVRFLVYGYNNRGIHEGKVGVTLYYYDCTLNIVEEELYIPYYKSYRILEKDIERLAYVSSKDQLYILIDGAVYNIDIASRATTLMQDSISETSFLSSDDQRMIAWQAGKSITDYRNIEIYKLDTMKHSTITGAGDEILMPIAFMDEDLVYGIAKSSDITTDVTGGTLIPFSSIKIQDENGLTLKQYHYPGIYILEANKKDNMIQLERVVRDEITGDFVETEGDQIVSNKVETTLKNKLTSVVTEATETTYQTTLYKEVSASSGMKFTNPKQVVLEGDRNIELEDTDTLTRYFVYARGELEEIYSDAADSVNNAQADLGVVVDKRMAYIWQSKTRTGSVMIEGLDTAGQTAISTGQSETTSDGDNQDTEENAEGTEEAEERSNTSDYARCLDVMLKANGVYKDTAKELNSKSVIQVLSDNLPDKQILELTSCNLSAVLYYVSRKNPVMALTGGGKAVLIIGYDANNTIQYDPEDGQVKKMGINDSAAFFEACGNRFITYVQ